MLAVLMRPVRLLLALSNALGHFGCADVKGTESPVPRHLHSTIVAFEVAAVELAEETADL